jgi:hypothetical protein
VRERSMAAMRLAGGRAQGCLLLACALLALESAGMALSAEGAVTHEFLPAVAAKLNEPVPATGPHGEPVPVPGPFSGLQSMTVDSGELFVAERYETASHESGTSRIDGFDSSSGSFRGQLPQLSSASFLHQGITVGHSTGEAQLYVAGDEPGTTNGVVAVLDSTGSVKALWTGTPEEAFGCFECAGPVALAVDANPSSLNDWAAGDVYVADRAKGVVDVFKPLAGGAREFVTQLRGPEPPSSVFSEPVGVAVNPSDGEVFIADTNGDSVDVFMPATLLGQYEFVKKLSGPPPSGSFQNVAGVTVDGGNGDVYVSEGTAGVLDEFSAAGKYAGRLTGTPRGSSGELRPFNQVESAAVDPVSHDVYVGDFREGGEGGVVDVFGPDVVLPDVTTGASAVKVTVEGVTGEGNIEATLDGTLNLEKEGPATCAFAWGTSSQFGRSARCEREVTEEEAPVHGHLNTLRPDTTYSYRLQGTNKNGTNPGESWQDQEFTTPGPGLRDESVSDVASSSVTLHASIDPHGAPTSFYLQYSTESTEACSPAHRCGLVPQVPAPVSGEGDVQVAPQHVQGLAPGTVYHYRVVAVSDLELEPGVVQPVSFAGSDQTFATQPASGLGGLPDGRRWELVSPPDKHGALMLWLEQADVIQAAATGGGLTFLATLPTEEHVEGFTGGFVQAMATRAPSGWSSQDISLSHSSAVGTSATHGPEYRAFSEDLSQAVAEPIGEFTSLAPFVSPPDTEHTPYLRHDSTCAAAPASCFEPLLTGAPGYEDVPEGTKFGGSPSEKFGKAQFVGASPDLAHILLSSEVALTTVATGGREQLYEWSGGRPPAQQLQLLSVLPHNGGPATANARFGADGQSARHAISDDGGRVVWSEEGGGQHLYVHDTTTDQTAQLDLVQPNVQPSSQASPQFQLASRDGSRLFFTDSQRLTADSGALPGQPDLYECEIAQLEGELRCDLSDLTPLRSQESAAVQGGLLGSSEDGSYLYFVANGVLGDGGEDGAVAGSCPGSGWTPQQQCNLYMLHYDSTTRVWESPRFIAVLSAQDHPDWGSNLAQKGQTARVSPDGTWLAFMSSRALTGYDNHDAHGEHQDEEVFLYNSAGRALLCASCNPTGARPVGTEYAKLKLVAGVNIWEPADWLAANIPAWTPYEAQRARYQSRYLSDSGRLFFNSSDALVAQDINNNEDVYQFEPAGVGDCVPSSPPFDAVKDGCVALISSGTAPGESAFLDASESGGDVFFLTSGQLTSQDTDTALDIYDAHACTATSPCLSAHVAPPACGTADACRAAPAPQPGIFGSPSSATLSATGNLTPQPPPRGSPTTAQIRAKKLAAALHACRSRYGRSKKRRAGCERQARRRYGKAHKAAHSANTNGKAK